MLIDDSIKNDIITILIEMLDESVPGTSVEYDWDREYYYCRICSGTSKIPPRFHERYEDPEDRAVKHKETCPVTLARKLLPIFKGDNNGTE